jgi:hypothetical protein
MEQDSEFGKELLIGFGMRIMEVQYGGSSGQRKRVAMNRRGLSYPDTL